MHEYSLGHRGTACEVKQYFVELIEARQGIRESGQSDRTYTQLAVVIGGNFEFLESLLYVVEQACILVEEYWVPGKGIET